MQTIRDNICLRASGVFLWVVLVVRTLNDAFDRGRISGLQKRLDEIPDGLDDLFTDILTRDSDDKDALMFGLQLLLFSRRTLKREELYFAILFETTASIEVDIDWLLHSTTAMDRRIIDVTKGLAEISKSDETIQFIHESVRDFLLQRNGLLRLHAEDVDLVDFIGLSHNRIKETCFDYAHRFCHGGLKREIARLGDVARLGDFSVMIASTPNESIRLAFPFLDYAIRNVLEHGNLAQAGGVPQEEFLKAYSDDLPHFKSILNYVQHLHWPAQKYRDDVSLLWILADGNLHDLIHLELLRGSHAWDLCGRYVCPMGIAFHNGNMACVRSLLGMNIEKYCSNSTSQIEPELIGLIKGFFAELEHQTLNSLPGINRTHFLLHLAFDRGHVHILRLFLYAGVVDFNDCLLRDNNTLICSSISGSQVHLVHFLLFEAKVSVEPEFASATRKDSPPLREVFRKSTNNMAFRWDVANKQIFDMVLSRVPLNWKFQDEHGQNAVHWAVLANDKVSMIRLINHGFDYKHCDSTGRDPLSYAAQRCCVKIVKALLEFKDIEVNNRDRLGRTPVSWAVRGDWNESRKATIETLHNAEMVDFNVKDTRSRTPLAWASESGVDPEIIKLLLSLQRVDVNSRDLYGRTPLILAVFEKRAPQVRALLQCGRVDIDAQDVDGRTALSWAFGPLNFLRSLLNRLASTQVYSVTASSSRWRAHDDDVLKEFLGPRRANKELTDNWGHAPMWWAQAHSIIVSELEKVPGEWWQTKPSLKSFVDECAARGDGLAFTEPNIVKVEIERFVKGHLAMRNTSEWDLNYDEVRLGENCRFEGVGIPKSTARSFFHVNLH